MVSLVVGFIAAFLLASLPGRALIARLRRIGAGQNISADAPVAHGKKQGTPTMGGLLILFAVTITTLAYIGLAQWGVHRRPADDLGLLPLLLLTLGYGGIGFADDYLSLVRGKNLGLRARDKFLAQCVIGVGFLLWMAHTAEPGVTTRVSLRPYLLLNDLAAGQITVDLGLWYYPIALLLIVGLSNATNFTDGLDGLLSGVGILICLALSALVAVMRPDLAFYLVVLAGGMAGFLWWNAHPAGIFMGDTASLALGAALAGVALIGKQEIGLIVASLVCWAELISVMIQVSVFKWRRRRKGIEYARANRVFRRTPLHHHFEEAGWPETQVVLRFWLVGAICAALALLWGRGNG
jgi:phospho-N-acetylmuramoyl-pentapeptide-transferase